MKTLNTKKIFGLVAYNQIRRTAPREFPTIEEMNLTVEDILPTLAEKLKDFIKFREESDVVNASFTAGDVSEEDASKKIREIAIEANKWEQKHGREIESFDFDNNVFNTFFQQFERWGKMWFSTLEDFIEFRKHMNETNKQSGKPKDEK